MIGKLIFRYLIKWFNKREIDIQLFNKSSLMIGKLIFRYLLKVKEKFKY